MSRDGPPDLLLVEDEPANRALIRAMLARSDRPVLRSVVVHEATTIAQARAMLAAVAVDVALLDVRLPDGSGLDLVAELLAAGGARPIRVGIVSASVLEADRASAMATGVSAFLAKPFDAAELCDLVERLLAHD